jgi:hypothetical protein
MDLSQKMSQEMWWWWDMYCLAGWVFSQSHWQTVYFSSPPCTSPCSFIW